MSETPSRGVEAGPDGADGAASRGVEAGPDGADGAASRGVVGAEGGAAVGAQAGANVEGGGGAASDEGGAAAEGLDAGGERAVAPDGLAGGPDGAYEDEVADAGANLPVEERVRRRVAGLDGIADLPLSEHAPRYDEVHAELQAALTEIDGESS